MVWNDTFWLKLNFSFYGHFKKISKKLWPNIQKNYKCMHLNLFVIYSLPGVIFFLCDLFLFLHFKNSHQALHLKYVGNKERILIRFDVSFYSFFKTLRERIGSNLTLQRLGLPVAKIRKLEPQCACLFEEQDFLFKAKQNWWR